MLVESKSSETMGYWTIGITIIGLYLGARRSFKVKQIRKKNKLFLEDGMYQHPSDCQKFIQCANGNTFIGSFSNGLLFDPGYDPSIKNCNRAIK